MDKMDKHISKRISAIVSTLNRAAKGLKLTFFHLRNQRTDLKAKEEVINEVIRCTDNIISNDLSLIEPGSSIISSFSGEKCGSAMNSKWIISPLSGFWNYLLGNPAWAISIAFEKDGKLIASAVFAPELNELFYAESDVGAYFNHQLIKSIETDEFSMSKFTLYNTDFAIANMINSKKLEEFNRKKLIGLNNAKECDFASHSTAPALDLARVALGYSTFITKEISKPEIAAGYLIVVEANAIIMLDESSNYVIASNTKMFEILNETIKDAMTTQQHSISI